MTVLVLVAAAALAQAQAQAQAGMARADPGTLEGRPRPEYASPLQARIDAATPGDRIVVARGTYQGDIFIDKPIVLAGEGWPRLIGSGIGSVIRVRAEGVEIDGFEIDGRGGGDLGRDSSGIHVAAPRVRVNGCRIVNALFGIYLREADGAVIEHCVIRGIPGRDPGEIGSGIHVWNTKGFTLTDNEMIGTRDGIYIQSSPRGTVRGNRARDLRYGLHYMFSDDNVFEDNTFENGAAGAALMYSRRLTFRRNRFLHNRGFASVGLLLKECDDVAAEDNLIADNARGLFLEGSYRNVFRRNVIAMSDQAIVLYDSSHENTFVGNAFLENFTPLWLVGRRTDTAFDGNYWSDHREPDLDGDGVADRPYRLSNVFDHFRGNLTAADLFARGPAAAAVGAAERAFPVLDAVPVLDRHPLVRMPHLTDVPAAAERNRTISARGTAVPALMLLLCGGGLLAAGGRSLGARR
jgi:nitrous oxidase accessory protein